MTKIPIRILANLTLTLALLASPCRADLPPGTGDRGTDMALDALVLRPLGLVSSVVGATLFTLSLPFTLPTGGVGEAACALVADPLAYTFSRPLGDLDNHSAAGSQPFGCGQ